MPGKPAQISPTGLLIGGPLTPTYHWNSVTGAVSYALVIFDLETFQLKLFESYTAATICAASVCEVTPTGGSGTLVNGKPYGWFVAALSYAGVGPWSDGLVFIPFVTPAPPSLISPSGAASNPVTYRWNRVQGATAYYVLAMSASGTTYVGIWVSASSVCNATTCEYTAAMSLPVGSYYWWVASGNPAGTSAYSTAMAFSISSAPHPAPTFEPAQGFNP